VEVVEVGVGAEAEQLPLRNLAQVQVQLVDGVPAGEAAAAAEEAAEAEMAIDNSMRQDNAFSSLSCVLTATSSESTASATVPSVATAAVTAAAPLPNPPNEGAAVTAGALKVAARLLASSSSACFLACACLSLQVNFFDPPTVDERGDEGDGVLCCSNCANRFVSFLGAGRETGVYAVPYFTLRKRVKYIDDG
jgi:hypothetical protein